MGKRERKIEVIKKYIDVAAGTWPGYSYDRIPQKLALAACYSYAGAIQPEDIIGLIDITVLNNGKKGMVFTETSVYYDNGMLGNRGSVSYRKIHETGIIPGDVLNSTYNSTAMKELVSMLSYIEGEDAIKEIGNTIDAGIDTIKEIEDTIDAGLELIQRFAGLFGGSKK